jgi:hypothetical protein
MVSKVNYRPQFLVSNDGSITIQYLSSGLTNIQTAGGGGGTPSAPDTSVQFNNAGVFGGSANFTYISGTNTVSFGNLTGSATSMTIQPLAPTSGSAGTLTLQARNAASGNFNGGGVTLNSGDSTGTGSAGEITFQGGASPSSAGALFVVSGGASGFGGGISCGAGFSASGTGGDFLFYLGGGGVDDGNMYFRDSGSSNFIHCKTATPGGGALQLGFFNATPVTKPAPTASGTGNVLSSVVTALNDLGLVDSTALTDAAANFTSAAQGLVPASGGGTTNFLRADGTFAAPPATAPASPTTSVQFNNAGVFGGSANFTYSGTGSNTLTIGPAGNNVNSTITTVAPTGSTATGILRLLGTNASATNGFGGGITLTTGNGTGTQRGGNFILTSGTGGVSGNGGNITMTSGTGRIGGNFTMESGFGSNTIGGSFTMSGGQGNTTGGTFRLEGGDGQDNGGAVDIFSGSTFAGASGDVTIRSGQGGAGGNGILNLQNGTILAKYSGGGDDPVVNQIGFYQTTPVDKPTVTGSRASGAALQDLLTKLASLGLITDSTSA